MNRNFVILDKTAFNQHTVRKYDYSVKNSKAFVTVPANKCTNKSLMRAIKFKGNLAHNYKTGSFDSDSFEKFIISSLVPYFNANQSNFLATDNP